METATDGKGARAVMTVRRLHNEPVTVDEAKALWAQMNEFERAAHLAKYDECVHGPKTWQVFEAVMGRR